VQLWRRFSEGTPSRLASGGKKAAGTPSVVETATAFTPGRPGLAHSNRDRRLSPIGSSAATREANAAIKAGNPDVSTRHHVMKSAPGRSGDFPFF
jgi:hypothetical protein